MTLEQLIWEDFPFAVEIEPHLYEWFDGIESQDGTELSFLLLVAPVADWLCENTSMRWDTTWREVGVLNKDGAEYRLYRDYVIFEYEYEALLFKLTWGG